ncbi:hypothetical protein EG68_09939 [Paragonimus skrjabini miyazakii]|uniref:Secreted protein n=1 Tax=Paragonimus skrjabini miyazakii TaxID=59628 RepID=A0A8S9YL23_9TREM|nr:hypothetical protein EG68_09939 [Paragonimus skrjabini miyazakii]
MRLAYIVTLTLFIPSLFAKENHHELMNQRNVRFRFARTRQVALMHHMNESFLVFMIICDAIIHNEHDLLEQHK